MESIQKRNCVLDKEDISRKMKRMALQVAEQNHEETELIIAGITGNGEIVAQELLQNLEKISSFSTRFVRVQLNKKELLDVTLDPHTDLTNKVIILVDDVANTGKTMLYALKPFLAVHPKKVQTMV